MQKNDTNKNKYNDKRNKKLSTSKFNGIICKQKKEYKNECIDK